MARTVGVLLSGCGVYDGSEIYEAALTLLYLDRSGVGIVCMAPDREQSDVTDHLTGRPADERRNTLVESARLARGEIRTLQEVSADELDGLVVPGGSGVAKTASDFARSGSSCAVDPEVASLIGALHRQKKPQGFICIAPVIAARILGQWTPELTVGAASPVSQAIEEMGGRHVICTVEEAVVDRTNRLVSTPAFMIGPTIARVAPGIERLVEEVLAMMLPSQP